MNVSAGVTRARLWFPLSAAELHPWCSVEHCISFPETFPLHWGEVAQFRQGGFQDVCLGKEPEILQKQIAFVLCPPLNTYTWRANAQTAVSLKVLLTGCYHRIVPCIFKVTKNNNNKKIIWACWNLWCSVPSTFNLSQQRGGAENNEYFNFWE